MALHLLEIEQVRTECRKVLETTEMWLRRLIHETLNNHIGTNYFTDGTYNNNPIFNQSMKKHAHSRMQAEPHRYARHIDTLLFDDLATIICKMDLYKTFFKDAFSLAFPDGHNEAHTFLTRIVQVRNPLSHSNPISSHDALRLLCYCADVQESLKDYYRRRNMSDEYNAPMFVHIADNLGNSAGISESRLNVFFHEKKALRPGDSLRVEVDVDTSFNESDYTINWVVANIPNGEKGTGRAFTIAISERHVGANFAILCTLVSKEAWHRHQNFDATITVNYKVLPPA